VLLVHPLKVRYYGLWDAGCLAKPEGAS